jgi:hypothetical protein
MRPPVVAELPPALEPVAPDPFAAGLASTPAAPARDTGARSAARNAPSAALTAVLLALVATWPAVARGDASRDRPADLSSYHGLAAWIDIFDSRPWERPAQTVRRLARRGVGTVFVQTSNYGQPRPVHRRAALGRMLRSAHRHGMHAVAWYLPGFRDLERDWRRITAAVDYESHGGHRFDGFALDIEATEVRDIAVRNRRMLRLSSRLRRLAGARYPLGAIIPDPVSQRYWPRFPYRAVRQTYDAILPMSYWTGRTTGETRVRRRTCRTLRLIRARTGDRVVPIHVVGGIASHASPAEVRGFARAAVACRATGASLYDAPITSARQWRHLTRLGQRRVQGIE